MEKNISYLNRTFADYKEALIEMSEKYYPDLSTSYDDASVASWMIDLAATLADNESYHIDRVYQETNVDSAHELGSLMSIARNNGVKIPGPKGAMAEMRMSVVIPNNPNSTVGFDTDYAPIIKRGTKFSASNQIFELLSDVDFNEQFDENGNSNRTITPVVNTNGIITGYTVSKLATVVAGETRVYRKSVYASDITPFMEILLPVENIMGVESIIVDTSTPDNTVSPTLGTFYSDGCGNSIQRYYEVDNLAETRAWSDKGGTPYVYGYTTNGATIPTYCITRGEWKTVDKKFITEYTDRGYLKVIFGAGNGDVDGLSSSSMTEFSKWQISRILNNNNLGVLPPPNSSIFILYRVGGGRVSNVAKGAINRVVSLNADFRGSAATEVSKIIKSFRAENTTPSVSGKDMPTAKELKYYIKYNKGAQNRCVTVKDYIDRILQLPPKYGTPFRVGVTEENNKIMIYLMGINNVGQLDASLPVTLVKNIEDYLEEYRMINDFIEIKPGRIINLGFNVDVIVDKSYNKGDVVSEIIRKVEAYMDINKHMMGEEIYIGDLQKEIGKIDGVINLIDLRVYNKIGNGKYSEFQIPQETINEESFNESTGDSIASSSELLVDLEASDGILYNEGDTMMEIKYPEDDIKVRIKER